MNARPNTSVSALPPSDHISVGILSVAFPFAFASTLPMSPGCAFPPHLPCGAPLGFQCGPADFASGSLQSPVSCR